MLRPLKPWRRSHYGPSHHGWTPDSLLSDGKPIRRGNKHKPALGRPMLSVSQRNGEACSPATSPSLWPSRMSHTNTIPRSRWRGSQRWTSPLLRLRPSEWPPPSTVREGSALPLSGLARMRPQGPHCWIHYPHPPPTGWTCCIAN
jgi:hypothetical protein